MDDRPVTPQERAQALQDLDPMTCPVRVYDQVAGVADVSGLRGILRDASERGWTR